MTRSQGTWSNGDMTEKREFAGVRPPDSATLGGVAGTHDGYIYVKGSCEHGHWYALVTLEVALVLTDVSLLSQHVCPADPFCNGITWVTKDVLDT